MGAQPVTGRGGQPRPGPGGRAKSGKPRPGTGGYGKHKLAGKGPTPPARLRPGHPAQRRASAAARPAAAGNEARGDQAAPRPESRPVSNLRGAGSAVEVVAGRNAVLESLRATVPVIALHVGPRLDADQRISEAISLAAGKGIPVVEAGRAELDRLTGGAIHQGVVLRVRPYSYAHPDDLTSRARAAGQQPLIIALDSVTDPRNLGAIVRSAAAFGAHGVLVPVRRSAGVTAGAWKASAGTLARVPVARAPNLVRTLAGYQEDGLFVVGLEAGAQTTIDQLDLAAGPLVLVVGSEGKGLSRLVTERCDAVAGIPILGSAESLNAGVAAGIALYEVARLRAAAAAS
jgi:23S rRNA (guanosine2251-2'-O)-methyltransferase